MTGRFCPACGSPLQRHRIGGEVRNHWICGSCSHRHYDPPRIIVTCFVACGKRLLWVRRALPPKQGCWAIPGGFLELDETLAQGAARELREESGVVLPASRLTLYMVGSITFINQIYIAFRAQVDTEATHPGPEALACRFFSREECPWEQVAYPEVNEAIVQAYDALDSGEFGVWHAQMTRDIQLSEPVRQSR